MNEEYETVLARVYFHFENIPKFMWNYLKKAFMDDRHEVVDVYNELIGAVNKEWDLTGEPASFGDYLEDINPKYIKLVQDRIQPAIDKLNKHFLICKYRIDKYGDIVGYVPFIKNSNIWIDFEEVKPN